MEKYLYIALFAPLFGSLFSAVFSTTPKRLFVGIASSTLLAVSLIASINLLYYVYVTETTVHVKFLDWISIGNLQIPFGFVVDQVSVVMMVVVTLVSTMVHIHSIGYMDHDKSFNRFFAWLSAFVFSMLILVMSDNFAGLFIGWEGVGLCSWGLIGFWYHKKDQNTEADIYNSPYSTLSPFSSISPSYAANEAFIMNRVADLGMLIGLFLIYWNIGSLQYDIVFSKIGELNHGLIIAIGAFLFIGAMGKSAQFPFNVWLANAMEGPTPVSALIHAATMVTAGVYLVVRANDIFTIVHEVGYFIAGIGTLVAFGAATMALVATNIKKIIAFSTLSQLGYMFVAAGVGAYWVALFHLATHAFFKSVLFLGAGNVMHATKDEISIKNMGGLFKYMPYTGSIMIIASLALSGIFPFAGFYSKDMILAASFDHGFIFLWFVLWVTAGLTAFYSFRLIMYTFFGKENFKKFGYHPHESYWYVIAAMTPLAILAIVAGWCEEDFVELTTKILPSWHPHMSHFVEFVLIIITSAMAIGGVAYAVVKFKKSNGYFSDKFKDTFIYKLLAYQYSLPSIYDRYIIQPYYNISKFSWKELDMRIVDAIVDGIASAIYTTGSESRAIQTGNLSKALKIMVFGLLVLLGLALILVSMK